MREREILSKTKSEMSGDAGEDLLLVPYALCEKPHLSWEAQAAQAGRPKTGIPPDRHALTETGGNMPPVKKP